MIGRIGIGLRLVRQVIAATGILGNFFLIKDDGGFIIQDTGDKIIIKTNV
jgi:hypothetical protein